MAKTTGTLHTIVSANAAPYVNELRRASSATVEHTSGVDKQFDKLRSKIDKKFSISDAGYKLLKGVGFGSAAGVASHVIEKFADMWRESSEYAKKLEERAKSIEEAMRSASKSSAQLFKDSKEDVADKLAITKRENDFLKSKKEQAEQERQIAIRGVEWAGKLSKENSGAMIYSYNGEAFDSQKLGKSSPNTVGMKVREFNDIMSERADAAQEKVAKIQVELDKSSTELLGYSREIKKKADDDRIKEMGLLADAININKKPTASEARGKISDEDVYRGQEERRKFIEERFDATRKHADELEKLAGAKMKVDDMTRRGLGTGGGYIDAQKQSAQLLAEIRDLLRRAEAAKQSAMLAD